MDCIKILVGESDAQIDAQEVIKVKVCGNKQLAHTAQYSEGPWLNRGGSLNNDGKELPRVRII